MGDIEKLRIVATVARTNCINDAAAAHKVSQPTVSRAVAAVEKLLGFKVFERTTMGTSTRPDAREVVRAIQRVVREYDGLLALSTNRPPTLRLAYGDDPIPALVESAIARWNRANTVQAEPVHCPDPIASLRAGEVEFAVVRIVGDQPGGLMGDPVRVLRDHRIELLHVPPGASPIPEFLRFLG